MALLRVSVDVNINVSVSDGVSVGVRGNVLMYQCINECINVSVSAVLGYPSSAVHACPEHARTADCSSARDCGAKVSLDAGLMLHTVVDIDPGEASNMPTLVAFECTQEAPQSFRLNDVVCENM